MVFVKFLSDILIVFSFGGKIWNLLGHFLLLLVFMLLHQNITNAGNDKNLKHIILYYVTVLHCWTFEDLTVKLLTLAILIAETTPDLFLSSL